MKNILRTLILIIILILIFSTNAQTYALSEVIKDGDDFIATGKSNSESKIPQAKLQEASGYLYNTLLTLGVVIAVIVATVLGVQFMIGGAEGQAKVKEMLLPFVIGCIVVFGAFGIWKVAITVGDRLDSHTASVTTKIECNHEYAKIDYTKSA